MNRFLTDLVERAERRTPLLERRPRSLFEPESPASTPTMQPVEREEFRLATPAPRVASDEVSRSPQTVEEPLEPHRTEYVRPAPRPDSPRAAQVERRDDRMPPPASPREAPRPARRSPDVARAAEAAASSRREIVPPAPLASPRAMPTPPSAARPEPAAPRRQATESSASERAASPRRQASAPTRREPLVPLTQRKPSTPPVAPTMVSRAQPLPKHPAVALARSQTTLVTHREQAAPPPVQITIGRVEVRAAPTGSERTPRDRGPAKPRLSLDEYLRQRGGASR
jgi:hypothetical protein